MRAGSVDGDVAVHSFVVCRSLTSDREVEVGGL